MARRHKTETRQRQIVEATLALLADAPLAQLTTRRIAQAIGVTQPALFRHFRSRDDLIVAVVAHARTVLGGVIEEVIGAGPGVAVQLDVFVRALFGFTEVHPGLSRLLFGDGAAGGGSERVQAALRQLVSLQRRLVAELVRSGQRTGELRADLVPARAASFFVGMLQGLILQWELGGRQAPLVRDAPELVRFWIIGAGADPDAPAVPVAATATTTPAGPARLQVLDARPILDGGDDPLDAILAAVEAAGPGGAVALTTPLFPKPLLALLRGRGHACDAREAAPGVWAVAVAVAPCAAVVDLRELPPPEPLEHLLKRTAALEPGASMTARTPRIPRLALPHLDARGLAYALHEEPDGACLVHIQRPA